MMMSHNRAAAQLFRAILGAHTNDGSACKHGQTSTTHLFSLTSQASQNPISVDLQILQMT